MNPPKPSLSRREFLHAAGLTALGAVVAGCSPSAPTFSLEATPTGEPGTPVPTIGAIEPTSTPAEKGVGFSFLPNEPPNQPIGTGRGIYPGRVVWAHNPDAALWIGRKGFWWQPENLDQSAVFETLAASLLGLTGEKDRAAAWQALFAHFNAQRGSNESYQPGEKIAVKLNQNACTNYAYQDNHNFSSPQLARALVEQLMEAGINPADITLYDSTRLIPDLTYNQFNEEQFSGLRFEDFGGSSGRQPIRRDATNKVRWSVEVNGNPTYLPLCVSEAKYIINLASLKGHSLAGVTLTAKNHFGTISADLEGRPSFNAPQGANVHGHIAAHDFNAGPGWQWPQCPMGTYNALVDLMAHPQLGEKTVLYVIEGFFAVHEQNTPMTGRNRFQSAPFNGEWPSSLFVSQDGVAIDSVGLDFLRNEPTIQLPEILPPGSTCENYLHEAAQVGQPPSGTVYNPTFESTYYPPQSLGVHEHWDSAETKQYSRNLGSGEGIELAKVS